MTDLPFQWDDGQLISPFVAASEADMEAFAAWLTARHLEPLVHARAAHTRQHEMRLTDLGCGDASAVLSLAQHLCRGWAELQRGAGSDSAADASLHLLVTGIDLDEALLEAAASNAATFAGAAACRSSSPAAVKTHFLCQDLRTADPDVYFPRRIQSSGGGAASQCAPPSPPRAPCVLYMYLLPEALQQLQSTLVDVMERGWIVASNRWPIPGLDEDLQERAGHVHVYYRTAGAATMA